jgi:carboxymethylenebutenolidase
MPKEVEGLITEAREGRIGRREFIGQVATLLGSAALAAVLFDCAIENKAEGAVVAPDDPGLESKWMETPAKDYTAFFYQSKPKGPGPFPAVIVLSQNRGVEEHIEDVTRRFAKEGYFAVAPDAISRFGGIQQLGKEAATGMVSGLRPDIPLDVIQTVFNNLRNSKEVLGNRIGVVGFCWGGSTALLTATKIPELAACVVYYGKNPIPMEQVQTIQAPVLGHYGSLDTGITMKVPELKEAMEKYGKSFESYVYEGAKHAFNDDTRASRYNAAAAKEAWARTLAFFAKHLKKPQA